MRVRRRSPRSGMGQGSGTCASTRSGPNLSRAGDHVAIGGELLQPDRAAGMDASRGDADLGAKTEFAAVAELRGGVPQPDGTIDAAQEGFGGGSVLGDD